MNVALIMAGGSGKRMQVAEKKQFLLINGKPLIVHTLEKICGHPEIDQVIIVAPADDLARMQSICEQYFPEKEIMLTAGGTERQISVINGLKACPSTTELVLIHDAVRPFVSNQLISELIKLAKLHGAVIPCSPVRNTIKRISGEQIIETVPRQDLYNAHTPQVFSYSLIYKYHEKALNVKHQFTDDSSILEYFQQPVYFYLCDDSNFKITQPYDLILAEYFLK